MHNSQELANCIKDIAKSKKIAIGKMLSNCELSINTLSSMQSGGYYPRLEAIAKIADYLDCSIDYLLGRTDVPEVNHGTDYGYGYPPQYAQSAAATGRNLENVLAPDEITELRALEEYDKNKNA